MIFGFWVLYTSLVTYNTLIQTQTLKVKRFKIFTEEEGNS